MALDARSLPAVSVPALDDVGDASPWSGNRRGGGGAPSSETTTAVDVDVPALWSDEGRMKRELVAWAKAVASMAIRESMHC
ncbi:hypothetical protein SETIT_7G119200v2 [Setaria italica]|uniref:Uncharacterized protein n=1 Tax=Setaria italica TaxID=4555 RepID=K3YBB1_SETIT|nr:uncharacterized protein LOC101757629 [Setaria italica]RCV33893.1 hypothetical protein SETIT_7G119200v2 [Setaria italica]